MGRDPNPERPVTLKQWEAVFGSPPPPYLSVRFMQKALAYETQCKALGGMPAVTRRALKRISKGEPACAARATSLQTRHALCAGVEPARAYSGGGREGRVRDGWPDVALAIGHHQTQSQGYDVVRPALLRLNTPAGGSRHEEDPLRDLYPQVLGRRAGTGV